MADTESIFPFDVLEALGIDFEPPLPANERLIDMDDEEIVALDLESTDFYRCLRCRKIFLDFASFMFACKGHIPGFHKILYAVQRSEMTKRSRKSRKFVEKSTACEKGRDNIAEEMNKRGKSYMCDWCGMTFGLRVSLKAHFKVHQNRLEQCQYCDGKFSRKKTLERHVSVVHYGGDKELKSNG